MFLLNPSEAVEVADALENMAADCSKAVAQTTLSQDDQIVQNMTRRGEYLRQLERRIRDWLNKEVGDSYGLKLTPEWKNADSGTEISSTPGLTSETSGSTFKER